MIKDVSDHLYEWAKEFKGMDRVIAIEDYDFLMRLLGKIEGR